ncbi:MAG: FtsQ-type POTRA domain-containing protein [Firmicutes bacterium]|nr:FtsQ-type POTRA domain-containing protein [Bacillota bacterium]
MAKKGGEVIPFKPRRRGPVVLRWLLTVGILTLLVGISLLHIPIFTLREIEVVGNASLSTEDVIRLSTLEVGTNLFRLRTGQLREWLKVSPWVKEVSIRRVLPDKLSIEIEERVPYFLVPYYTSFLEVAADGTILCPASADLKDVPLPILTGLKIEDPVLPGQSLHCREWDSLISVMEGIPSDFPLVIVEVHLSRDKELVFYTSEGIQILFGQAVDIAQKIALIHNTCQEIDDPLQTINVRSGERVHVLLKQYGSETRGDFSPDLGKNNT